MISQLAEVTVLGLTGRHRELVGRGERIGSAGFLFPMVLMWWRHWPLLPRFLHQELGQVWGTKVLWRRRWRRNLSCQRVFRREVLGLYLGLEVCFLRLHVRGYAAIPVARGSRGGHVQGPRREFFLFLKILLVEGSFPLQGRGKALPSLLFV